MTKKKDNQIVNNKSYIQSGWATILNTNFQNKLMKLYDKYCDHFKVITEKNNTSLLGVLDSFCQNLIRHRHNCYFYKFIQWINNSVRNTY